MRGQLNIVYDVAYPFVEGGGQKRIFEVATRLVRRGWNVTWYTFQTWEGSEVLREHGITYVGLPGVVPLYSESGRRSRKEVLVFGCAVWKRRNSIQNADVLWCGQWPYSHLVTALFSSRAIVSVDWWETWGGHWFEYAGYITGFAGVLIERVMATLCARRGSVIAISPRGAEDVLTTIIGKSCQASVKIISNGIDLNEINQCNPSACEIDIIYVGRLKDHKNVDHLVRAVWLLREEFSLTVHAAIIGGGPEESALHELAETLGVDGQVRFLSDVNDQQKYSYMKAARIFVHPSTKEGGGSITLLESLACGTPVVMYDTPNGIDPSYISEGKTGWLVRRVCDRALAAVIAEAIGVVEKRGKTIKDVCEDVARQYGWDVIAANYDELFGSALKQKRSPTIEVGDV